MTAVSLAKQKNEKTKKSRQQYFGLGRPNLKQFVVDARDPGSLLYAAQHGHEQKIRSRCEKENICPDEEVDKNGLTALHYAAGRGDVKIAQVLLDFKAGVDTRNKDLRTPLMWAARNGHMDVCEELVRRQAPCSESSTGRISCFKIFLVSSNMGRLGYQS